MTPHRILVVDDHPDSRMICELILARNGYTAISVGDGLSAVAAIRETPPDAIILDLALPRLDGWGVIREIQRDPRTRRIPVVLLTANFFDADRLRASEAGCAGYLVKPCSPQAIVDEVKRCLPTPPVITVDA